MPEVKVHATRRTAAQIRLSEVLRDVRARQDTDHRTEPK
jgi:hypothetical protein